MMYIELFAGAEQLSCLYQKQRTYLRKFGVQLHRITEWWRLAGTPGSIWHNSFSSRGTQGKRAHNPSVPSVFHFVPMASCKKATFPCYFGCYIENFSHWTDFFYLFFFFSPWQKSCHGWVLLRPSTQPINHSSSGIPSRPWSSAGDMLGKASRRIYSKSKN